MNNITPPLGTRDGNWIWDGTRWVCDPDCEPCPPFSILQPGRPSPFFPPPVTQPPWYPGANGGVSFAPPGSPPPNPIRGAFWWDGTSLWLFDGAAWDVVGGAGGGVITPPGSTFPTNPQPGQQFFDGKMLWIWDGTAWVPLSTTKTYVQSTAPSAPHPGDMWFDGTQLRIWSGSAWDLVGPGATVGPVPTTTKVFSLIQSTVVALGGVNIFKIVPFTAAPVVDLQTAWDPATYRFVPKVAGNYAVYIRSYGPGTGSDVVAFNDTGSVSVPFVGNFVALAGIAGAGNYLAGSGMVHMNGTTDFLRYWRYSADGNWDPLGNIPAMEVWLMP